MLGSFFFICSAAFGILSLIHAMSRNTPPWGLPALLALPPDAAGHVVASQKLGRASRVLVSLRVSPAFFFRIGGLAGVQRRNIFEHESLAIPITHHSSLAAHSFRDQNAAYASWPNHSRRMELDKFHVHQRRTGMVGERMAIARLSQLLLVIL